MRFKSKKTALILMGIASIASSRIIFLFNNDPEGPNLIVVMGLAAIIFFVSLSVYLLAVRLGRTRAAQ
jgi:hypothetical protein